MTYKYVAVIHLSYDNTISYVTDWHIKEITRGTVYNGNDMASFVDTLYSLRNRKAVIYIHDLEFVGLSIFDYLLHHNYNWVDSKYDFEPLTFTSLVNQDNIYNIDICFDCKYNKHNEKTNKKVTIINSGALYPPTLTDVAKYTKINDDIENLSIIINMLAHYGLLSSSKHYNITIAQASLNHFKQFIGSRTYSYYFPTISPEVYNDLREAYFGGYTYINDRYVNSETGHGYVLDNNGLYADVMRNCLLPYGTPVKFEGNYYDKQNRKYHSKYPLYIQHIKGDYRIKPNALPCIPQKESIDEPNKVTYIHNTSNRTLFLSNVDIKWLYRNYYNNGIDFFDDDDYGMQYCGGYMFKASDRILKPWIDYWCEERVQAEIDGDVCRRKLCKIVINALSGKFASGNAYKHYKPIIDGATDTLAIVENEVEVRDIRHGGRVVVDENTGEVVTENQTSTTQYLPISIYITAYGRDKTLSLAQQLHINSIKQFGVSRYIYSDTDSVHFELDHIPTYIDINEHEIGKWKVEYEYDKAKYVGLKTYMLHSDKGCKLACSGLPRDSFGNVMYDTFGTGQSYEVEGKAIVRGGASKVRYNFTLGKDYRTLLCHT